MAAREGASSELPIHPERRLSALDRMRAVLFGLAVAVGLCLALVAPIPLSGQVELRVGEVSTQDIRAPRRIKYVSNILTEQERKRAEAAVREVYDPPQARVAREQVSRARDILNYVDSVRQDIYATPEQRVQAVRAVPDLTVPTEVISRALALPDDAWERVAREIPLVIDRAMREEIRETQLPAVQRVIPALVSLDLSEEESEIAGAFASALIRPNTFLNVEKTNAERQAARERVEPVFNSYEQGEIIVRTGEVITPLALEALEALGMRPRPWSRNVWAGAVLFSAIVSALFCALIHRFKPEFWSHGTRPWFLALTVVAFAWLGRLMVPAHTILPFIYPLAAMTMLIGALLDMRFAVLGALFLSLAIGYMTDGSLEIMAYSLIGSLAGALALGRGERPTSFVWAGAAVALSNLALLAAFRLPSGGLDVTGALQLASAAIINGGISASLALICFLIAGSAFGVTTTLQLMELSRPTHPLLRQLLLAAPGTYHHTLLLSNMAERAAEAIGADAYLARVGAYYHDIGKISQPYFFSENQSDGNNPHDHLAPEVSARIIIDHVRNGLVLARKYRLPPRIQDFIVEHHGNTLVTYFYRKACEASDKPVDERRFRYPGPRPRSKETAIVMLADSCEALVRSCRPGSAEEIDRLVSKMIADRLSQGELDDSDLTLRDLDRIRRCFVAVLQGVHHPRIQYPEPEAIPAVAPSQALNPAPPALPATGVLPHEEH
jgi:putative nucleotidyltransferase with HDIG domain